MSESKQVEPLFLPENSPVVQAAYWGGPEPYPWQYAVMDACWRKNARVAVRTANESGKSSVTVPILALSWAAAFPGSTVVLTSNSHDQLNEQVWPTVSAMAGKFRKWTVLKDCVYAPKVSGLPQAKVIKRITNREGNYEGFHDRVWTENGTEEKYMRAAPLLIVMDEAKSIPEFVFNEANRCRPTTMLYISTTGEDAGPFFDACMDRSGLWTTEWMWNGEKIPFQITMDMCPHLRDNDVLTKEREYLISTRGRSDPYVRSRFYAEFYASGAYRVFSDHAMKLVRECMNQIHRHKMPGERVAFCDFSSGGDELTFGLRDGNYVHPIEAWHYDGDVAPSEMAKRYVALFQKHGLQSSQIYGDNGGYGKAIIDELERLGWRINRVNNERNATDKRQFANCYAEAHWNLLSHLKYLILPQDEELFEQMRTREYVMENRDNNTIRMERKAELRRKSRGRSPDRLDTLVGLCMSLPPVPEQAPAIAGAAGRTHDGRLQGWGVPPDGEEEQGGYFDCGGVY